MRAWRRAARATAIGRVCFGLSSLSFAFEQGFYLQATAGFVPKWIPPGQTFWAIGTTVAFVLAAVAIVSGRQALLATRLVTAMLSLFGIVVWLPALFADPKSHGNWSETTETFAIAGAAWILAASLRAKPWAATRRVR
jgi:Mn2+/Fe2+ NRAMP family transporter